MAGILGGLLFGLMCLTDDEQEDLTYGSSRMAYMDEDDDPYNARDCGDEVEFYEEHMDDFSDFEEAEDYYYDHT